MRVLLRVGGTVQGVGFRPQVYVLAQRLGLTGWVKNDVGGARLEVQGSETGIESFVEQLHRLPAPARVERIECVLRAEQRDVGFRIEPSDDRGAEGGVPLSPDLRTCERCFAEMMDPSDRRYQYPFISCAGCGPRYSISFTLPYDRSNTSMADFELCDGCQAEFDDPEDRRMHAQAIACAECGPRLRLLNPAGRRVQDGAPLEGALAVLRRGGVLGLLGLGGFQLLVDATNEEAVATLRARKRRPHKPLAVMFEDLAAIRRLCRVSEQEAQVLSSAMGPILLLEMLDDAAPSTGVGASVRGPNNTRLGVMLPTTGLHRILLARLGRALVCTSGNISGEPLCVSMEEAVPRLGPIVDCFLTHDRAVVRPVDDSVGQWGASAFRVLRRARGAAPGAEANMLGERAVLALGAQQKHTFTLARKRQAIMSPHLGDLESVVARERLENELQQWLSLLRVKPEVVACDLHEGYVSSQLAATLSDQWQVPLLRFQHHHAHIAAVLAEHEATSEVLGLAWDGSGLGDDGTLWGGEALSCRGASGQRVGHLLPFQLPGGARAMLEPRRSLLGLLHGAGMWDAAAELSDFTASELDVLQLSMTRQLNAPWTSSMGRLFDASAALAGARTQCSFEGQVASEWMMLAERCGTDVGSYPLELDANGIADWRAMVSALLEDKRRAVGADVMARRFHETLARLSVRWADASGFETVVLAGGCFQNRLLLELCVAQLSHAGHRVLVPRRLPPNDGAISLGQAWLACHPETSLAP